MGRNHGLKLSTIRRYFIGNGFLLWMLSPINVLLDLLSLPYTNKGIYRLEDLPSGHQVEVRRLIRVTDGSKSCQSARRAGKNSINAQCFLVQLRR